MEPHIQFKNVTKKFGGTTALSEVSFEIQKGEVHCICGENGAGKSTLINLCAGVFEPTSGEIWVNGKHERINSIQKSEKLGFSIVHQEVPLCTNMSIANNIFLGSSESMKGIFINESYMREKTQELLDLFQLKLEPTRLISSLSIAEQSMIQIAKAVYYKPDILILDEPTAALTNDQRNVVFDIIRKMKKELGTTIIYVSHRLEEVMDLGDRTSILRDGHFITTKDIKDITIDDIVQLMVGREIDNDSCYKCYATDEVLLEVKGFSKDRQFNNISFDLKKGEILGIAGFVGAGRTELLNSIFGINKPDEGELYIHGKKVPVHNCSQAAIKNRIALIPENRRDDALMAELSVKQNAQVVILKKMLKNGLIDKRKSNKIMDEMVKKYHIKTSDADNCIMTLSGGNQQKVIIARWLANEPEILMCDEPTRGIDVGAKAEIYELLRDIAQEGIGIVMVSSELPELLTLCDRIIVMHEGRKTGELTREEATEEQIMKYAAAIAN